jgi:phosphohistidine phosphatase SixA
MLAEASTTSRQTARVQTPTALQLIELFNGNIAGVVSISHPPSVYRYTKSLNTGRNEHTASAAGLVQLGRAKCVRRKTMCANAGGGNPGD